MKKFARKAMAVLAALLITATNVVALSAEPHVQENEFIPIRAAFEALNAEVEWVDADRSIKITFGGITLELFADNQSAYANNVAITLQNSIFIVDGTSFIHPDDYLYALMRLTGVEIGSHLSETVLEANLIAPLVLEQFSVAGIAVAIVDVNNDFTWTQGFGHADTTQGIPVDENTVFGIGSISKTFAAIAIMQLVGEGIIDLDAPIVEYLPYFSMQISPEIGGDYRNITTRMLLTHTAGIFSQIDLTDDLFSHNYMSLERHEPYYMDAFLEIIAGYYLESPEGTVFSYSNNSYNFLGVLIAVMTGADSIFDGFVSYTNENIFVPAGMERTGFVLDESLMPYLALPYVDANTPDSYLFSNGLPAASMVSTAYDMAHFMHLLLRDDGALLAPGTIEYMMQPHDFDFYGTGLEYGLGFVTLATDSGLLMVGHDGSRMHYEAFMFFDAERGIGVFVAINSLFGAQHRAAMTMGTLLLEMAVLEIGE